MGNQSSSVEHSKFDSVASGGDSASDPRVRGDTMLRGTKAASSGNAFVDAMDISMKVTNEKGAPALSAAQTAKGHVDMLVRGGGLVVANTRMVGSRKGTGTGISRAETIVLVNDLMREAAAFSGEERIMQVVDVFRLLAYTRDIDTGKGERDISYWFFLELHRFYPKTCVRFLQMLYDTPDKNPYGAFLDYNKLYALCHNDLDTTTEEDRVRIEELQAEIVRIYCVVLKEDMRALEAGEGLSLAGKWAPRVGSSVDKKCGLGKRLAAQLFPPLHGGGGPSERGTRWSQTVYRKTLSGLNKRLETVEVTMCAKRFRDIDPTRVPSKALKLYNLAMRNKTKKGDVRHTEEDRVVCATNFEKAFEEARKNPAAARTIKGARLQGYELTEKYCAGYSFGTGAEDPGVEAQWAVLVESVRKRGKMMPGIAICDTSGSMHGIPMFAGLALGYIMARISEGPWHNLMMTFSSRPSWVRFDDSDSLHGMMKKTPSIVENTNFEAAMALILKTAVKNSVPPADLPKVLYVFTDMNFDQAQRTAYGYGSTGNYKTAYTALEKKFREHGYEVPHMVFWNLRANGTPTFQTSSDQPNTSMMAGFNQGAFTAFMDGDTSNLKEETPWERLSRVLDVERYDPVCEACAKTGEGFLAGYVVPVRPVDGERGGAAGGAGGD